MSRFAAPLLVALALVAPFALTACGGDGGASTRTSGQPAAADPSRAPTAQTNAREGPPAPGAQATGTEIALRGSDFGHILFDGSRQAIYLFEKEKGRRSECYGACAAAWPPVLTDALPSAASGVDRSLLGTIARRGGGRQVTYAGHPLYYYADDPPGQVLCNGVVEYGGRWAVLGADGQAAA